MKQLLLSVWILLLVAGWVQADIVQPKPIVITSHMDMRVEIVNLAEFAGMQFYLSVPSSEDPNGSGIWLQFAAGKSTILKGSYGSAYFVAHKGDVELTASESILNSTTDAGNGSTVLHQKIKVLKVDDGEVKFEVLSNKVVPAKSKQKRSKTPKPAKGSVEGLGWLGTFGIPLACLLGLVAFFLFRRKPSAQ